MTTVPGAASPCSRAARFGVSPTTASSRDAPSPISSPTTTSPVATPTRQANASPSGVASRCHRRDQPEPGPDRALGRVLVRRGPAEIGQHAVAQELGDVAVEAGDPARHRVLEGAQQAAHLLGVEPAAQRRRADEVDEHHRELAPLGTRRDRGRLGRLRRGGQVADRLQDRLARPERQAELAQVGVGQLGQDVGRELGVAERLRVALQPEPAQPGRDVHVGPTRCRLRASLA